MLQSFVIAFWTVTILLALASIAALLMHQYAAAAGLGVVVLIVLLPTGAAWLSNWRSGR